MNVLIDIILISVFAYFVFKYFKAGLFVSVLGIGKPIASLFLALTFGSYFSDLFLNFFNNETSFSEQISEIISLIFAYAWERLPLGGFSPIYTPTPKRYFGRTPPFAYAIYCPFSPWTGAEFCMPC